MKSTIPVLAIPVLSALVLVACNQKSPINSTETPSPNSSMGNANGMMGGMTNMAATHSMSNMGMPATRGMTNTNMPATRGTSNMDMPARPTQ
jgi:hypothetical protein